MCVHTPCDIGRALSDVKMKIKLIEGMGMPRWYTSSGADISIRESHGRETPVGKKCRRRAHDDEEKQQQNIHIHVCVYTYINEKTYKRKKEKVE